MNFKPLPIGIENFKEIIDKKFYYVDKTLIIKELLDSNSKVTLFTRPRRFGNSKLDQGLARTPGRLGEKLEFKPNSKYSF